MPTKRTLLLSAAVLCAAMGLSAAENQPESDPYQSIAFLVGRWHGRGSGMGGNSTVTHTYEYVIQDKFLHMKTRSEFRSDDVQETGEIHEDWGFFSYDPDRGKLILRPFLSEGYVNTYVLNSIDDAGKTLVFTTESAEGAGGMAARITYHILGSDQYELSLDLAPPGKDFFSCRKLQMNRQQTEDKTTR